MEQRYEQKRGLGTGDWDWGLGGPIAPVLERLDRRLRTPVVLSDSELDALVDFVRDGLLDPAARPQRLRRLIPEKLPSGRPSLVFQF
jgi:cytochrome c peroxidase